MVRGSGWSLAEVESLSLEGEGISSLRGSFDCVGRLVYLNLARNNLSSLLVSDQFVRGDGTMTRGFLQMKNRRRTWYFLAGLSNVNIVCGSRFACRSKATRAP